MAQLVELLLPKADKRGSNPVNFSICNKRCAIFVLTIFCRLDLHILTDRNNKKLSTLSRLKRCQNLKIYVWKNCTMCGQSQIDNFFCRWGSNSGMAALIVSSIDGACRPIGKPISFLRINSQFQKSC